MIYIEKRAPCANTGLFSKEVYIEWMGISLVFLLSYSGCLIDELDLA